MYPWQAWNLYVDQATLELIEIYLPLVLGFKELDTTPYSSILVSQ